MTSNLPTTEGIVSVEALERTQRPRGVIGGGLRRDIWHDVHGTPIAPEREWVKSPCRSPACADANRMMPWFLGLCGLAVPYGSTRSAPTVDNGGMTATYMIRPITPRDDAAMAALIRRSLEDAGLDRPGTAYCDRSWTRLAEYYAGLERPGAYWVAVEAVGSRDDSDSENSGSGYDDGGGDDCDSGTDSCGVSGHDMNVYGTHDLGADGVVVGGVGVAAWPGSGGYVRAAETVCCGESARARIGATIAGDGVDVCEQALPAVLPGDA